MFPHFQTLSLELRKLHDPPMAEVIFIAP
jgi:hypothetical protein